MKNFLYLIFLTCGISYVNSQAYAGSGDQKLQVGANIQEDGTGLNVSYDYGVGQNISLGVSSTYLLGVNSDLDPDFLDRFDVRARFNANIGNVLMIDENFDIYPGLSFGLKNFGGHLGARYFFSQGFGVFTEFNVPLAKYNPDDSSRIDDLNNQFSVNIGASFNL